MTVFDYLDKKLENYSKRKLLNLISNFLSETKYRSELERVYYEECQVSNTLKPSSSNYIFSRSSYILEMDLYQLSQKHPNFIEQFDNWFQKKISEIEYLESKKLDSRISGKQKETISAVLKELEFSLGLK